MSMQVVSVLFSGERSNVCMNHTSDWISFKLVPPFDTASLVLVGSPL